MGSKDLMWLSFGSHFLASHIYFQQVVKFIITNNGTSQYHVLPAMMALRKISHLLCNIPTKMHKLNEIMRKQ